LKNEKISKEEKNKIKEHKILEKFLKRKDKVKNKYLTRSVLIKKYRNAQTFTNSEFVNDNGIIKLRDNSYARVYSVDAIDLSLTSNIQKQNFFHQLKYLYQLKGLNLRIYKLDDKIDLNANKDHYNKLMEEYSTDEQRVEFLKERYYKLEELEHENLTTTSRYYFVIVNDNEKALEHIVEEVEMQCYNMTPRLNIKMITNKLEIYQFLVNLYLSTASIDQLMWSNLVELITPFFIQENMGYIKADEDEIQIITIKKLPPFIDELFFEELFNVPDTRSCIHIKDTIPTDELVKRLDSNYEFLMTERNTTRKLSDATQMDAEKENFQALMTQIKNGDEKIKEVDFIIVINGNKKQREEKLKELRKIADIYQIKLDAPRMRQLEGWQAFDINKNGFEDYHSYLPSLTLAASFPLTITNFNDETGYMLGADIHTALPTIFDIFHKDATRPSSNLAVIASTGGGKSFTLKKMIINEINRGNKIFIFDAEGEYQNLVNKNKGEYIDMYSSSGGIINPLQVRFLPSDKEEKTDNDVDKINYEDCPLAKHLGSLETFIKCAFEEIKESEVVVLLDMIEKLYKRFGITKNTKISSLEKLENTDYPIFTDLIEFLPDYKNMITNQEQLKIVDKLEILLDRFKVGIDSMLFNGYTSVNLDSNLIAFNVKDLLNSKNKRVITTQLVNLLTYLNNIIVQNKIVNDKGKEKKKIKNIAVIIDEFHLYLKNTDSEVLLTFEQIARRIRKYHGAFIPATQSIHDFIGDDDSVRSATAIFNNCQYQLVGMLKEDDLTTYLRLFYQNPLTDTQKEFLTQAKMGEFLLTVNSKNRIRIKIEATPMEIELMKEVLL
jgi:putative membrane-bound ATPase